MKIKKKGYSTYEKGGSIDPPKDRSKDIEALKTKYRETKDPNVKKDLDSAREEQKLYDSGQFMDDMREGRAQKAETKGDEGRAKRIRSSKQTQGLGETGRDKEGKKFFKGGKMMPKAGYGMRIKKKK